MRNQLLSRFSNYALYSKIKLGFMWQLALKEWGAPFYGRRAANFSVSDWLSCATTRPLALFKE